MSAILGTSVTGAGGASAYSVSNSLRFRRGSPSYLSRTFSSGSLRLWTWSAWIKRGVLGTDNSTVFDTNSSVGGEPRGGIKFRDDCLYFNQNPSGSSQTTELKSTAVFRDPSAWYHVVVAWDTAQATAADRVKMYVNGVQITSFQISTYPGQNTDSAINGARTHKLGTDGPNIAGEAFDGYLAEVNFIGGLALTPSSFGEINASTGVWQPKAYTGSYSGTNSFYQKYSSIATTSGSNTGLGQDFSGNGNYFNTNNISVTPGATYDAMTDSPTPVSDTVGNYCVLNPIGNPNNPIVSIFNANLNFSHSASPGNAPKMSVIGTIGANSGKWYYEYLVGSTVNDQVGISDGLVTGGSANGTNFVLYGQDGTINNTIGTVSGSASSFTTNDIIGVAYDLTAQTVVFYKNNTLQATVSGIGTLTAFPLRSVGSSSTGGNGAFNFGQRPFAYTPPAGFNRLQTFNLPTPAIGASSTTLANKYFDISLYTGTGSARSVTGLNFQPDWVWIKERSSTSQHALFDAVRGVQKRLVSDSTAAEDTSAQLLTAFNSNGFSVGTDGALNENGQTYVAWNWKANGSGSTNTAGSITSTVSANTTAGFSVVTYAGNGSSGATVGHGLGSAPKMIVVKSRNSPSNSWNAWQVYHTSLPNPATSFLRLNETSAVYTGFAAAWNSTNPTSSVFSVSYITGSGVNGSGDTFVAYCFAEVAGFSKFGSYTGNGSADGTFVYTGFRPRYVMIKRTDSSGDWWLYDTARSTSNTATLVLYANSSAAEISDANLDILSNGFKLRTATYQPNTNGGNFIYMAFAESPFNYSLAR